MSTTKNTTPVSPTLATLVQDEAKFTQHIRGLVRGMQVAQSEIGEIICAFEAEHGHRYGDKLMPHIADLAGISLRSVYNYRNAWLVGQRHSNNADLQNLSHSHHVELGRLIDHPDGERLVGEAVEKIRDGSYTVQQTQSLVTEMLRSQRRKPAKPKEDPQEAPVVEPSVPETLGVKEVQTIEDVIAVLQRASSVEVKAIPHIAEHRQRLVRLGTGLVDHIAAMIEAEPHDAWHFESTLLTIRSRCDELLARCHRKGEAA